MDLKVLVIDDEPGLLQMLQVVLGRAGYGVTTVTSAREGLAILSRNHFDLCLCDLRMPGMDGMGFLAGLKTSGISMTVIVMSAYGSGDDAIAAMKSGAYDYINKPFQSEEILLTLRKAVEREQLRRENSELRSKVSRQSGAGPVIARAEAMRRVVAVATRIAAFRSTVLITGESGTGKEVIAKLIHEGSDRSRRPFVAVNCGAIPEGLMESEFFGHVKGAFTDAVGNKQGLIESAGGGTLFLDEVGELPSVLQVKILRFLQESEIRRVGDTRPVKVDVRVIAATSRDLEQEIGRGNFREDLYYRLNVVPIKIPPLRVRLEDIPVLADHFLRKIHERTSCQAATFSPEAMRALIAYSWPGNVRELENMVERVAVMCDAEIVPVDALPDAIRPGACGCAPSASMPLQGLSLKVNQRELEILLITRALEATGGNRTHAARILEMSHRALLYKLKEYGLGKID